MRTWTVGLLLLALPAMAGQVDLNYATEVEILGWTQDSKFFAWTFKDPDKHTNTWNLWNVEQRTSQAFPDLSGKEAWVKAHPLAPLKTGPQGPNGVTAEVVITKGTTGGKWDKSSWSPDGYPGSELRVTREGKSVISVDWNSSVQKVRPIWAPDGRQVAWYLFGEDDDGNVSQKFVAFGGAGLPRVHVLGAPPLLKTQAPALRTTLDSKGFITTYVGKSLKARKETVVYAAPGMEEQANKVAKLIRTGAKVEKLNWVVDADLVVALGSELEAKP